jgi:ATP-dependent DNA helicase RecG
VTDGGKIKGERLTNSLKSQIVSMARNCDPTIPVSVKQAGRVVVIGAAEGTDKPYSCSAGYYQRLDAVTQKMTQKEIRAIFRETVDRLFEDLPRKDCSLDDRMGKVERMGSGIRRMKSLMKQVGLKSPVFENVVVLAL